MNSCGRYRDQMAQALYAELDEAHRAAFEEHLRGCEACAALYAELRATVASMSRRQRPDPGRDFWDGYWQRLDQRVVRETAVADASRFGRRWSPGSWGYRAAAAVLVLAAGVWIGRTVLAPAPRLAGRAPETLAQKPSAQETPPVKAPADGRPGGADLGDGAGEQAAAARPQAIDAPPGASAVPPSRGADGVVTASNATDDALHYIGRTQVVLLALINGAGGDGEAGDFSSERSQARVLLAEGERLHDELTRPQDRRLRELVAQLEMILREIANLEAERDLDAVEMIRNRVDREGVMLRIDLQQLQRTSAQTGRGDKKSDAFN